VADELVLGLDLGTSSIGWGLINLSDRSKPIVDSGVRIFPEGVDRTRGEKSLNQERRTARSLRRQTYRRVRRKRRLLQSLRGANLLPEDMGALHNILNDAINYPVYQLRTKALDEELSHYEFGRALYHLGQRRGYLSNRKTGAEKDGAVNAGIQTLNEEIKQASARTLGEYFAGLERQGERIRSFYTARQMFVDEFEAIWNRQTQFKPNLKAHKKRIFNAIFDQRPLKVQKHLIGKCQFEPDRKRAYAATLVAQEFRLWQNLNNLKVLFADGSERFLNEKERLKLYESLKTAKSKSWGAIKKSLGFYEADRFNLERVRKTGLPGNQTAAIVSAAIDKKRWKAMPTRQQEQLVFDLLNIEQEEALKRRLVNHWKLDNETAARLVEKSVSFPRGVMHLSHKALRKILYHLRARTSPEAVGIRYDEACGLAGYHHSDRPDKPPEEFLPLFNRNLRNPMVERAIHQVRRVVNAVIREYGQPGIIRVEMARDLMNSRKQREEIQNRQRDNEKANREAKKFLEEEAGIPNPGGGDLLKYRLWVECGRQCVFTGKSISVHQLFGDAPVFEVEHILPYSRTLDNGYMNKTLCHTDANREKGKRTPKEAFSGSRYDEILQRAKKLPLGKFRRFSVDLEKTDRDFVSQQLNETRYIAREVKDYLSCLDCKVESVKSGEITAVLRRSWGLNNILSDSGEKTRLDHRHHAIDALVVALVSRGTVQQFSRCHAFGTYGQLRMENLPCPIDDIRRHAEQTVTQLVVSHKTNHKIKGALHEESLYGLTGNRDEHDVPEVVIRKPVASFKNKKQLEEIRDPAIRAKALSRLDEAGGDIKKALQDKENPFGFATKKGKFVPIKSVRCVSNRSVTQVGQGLRARQVYTRGNHHIEIVELIDRRGRPEWKARAVVTTLEAMRRHARGLPVVDDSSSESERFICALHRDDMVELEDKECKGERIICRVQKMDVNGRLVFRKHMDADISDPKKEIRFTAGSLRKSAPRQIRVNCLGKVGNR